MPARVASWVRSLGTGVSRSGRARRSAAREPSSRARRASARERGAAPSSGCAWLLILFTVVGSDCISESAGGARAVRDVAALRYPTEGERPVTVLCRCEQTAAAAGRARGRGTRKEEARGRGTKKEEEVEEEVEEEGGGERGRRRVAGGGRCWGGRFRGAEGRRGGALTGSDTGSTWKWPGRVEGWEGGGAVTSGARYTASARGWMAASVRGPLRGPLRGSASRVGLWVLDVREVDRFGDTCGDGACRCRRLRRRPWAGRVRAWARTTGVRVAAGMGVQGRCGHEWAYTAGAW